MSVMTNQNGPFKDHLSLSSNGNLRVCHLNIEGISKPKCEVLSKIMDSERIDMIALQETYTKDNQDISKRGFIRVIYYSERYIINSMTWLRTSRRILTHVR